MSRLRANYCHRLYHKTVLLRRSWGTVCHCITAVRHVRWLNDSMHYSTAAVIIGNKVTHVDRVCQRCVRGFSVY